MHKLSVKGMALGLGVCWGISVLALGWIAASGWGVSMVNVLGSLYIGYNPSFIGGIIGGIWAFFDGAIGGAIIAWAYNSFSKKD